jgi:hypothetical protein
MRILKRKKKEKIQKNREEENMVYKWGVLDEAYLRILLGIRGSSDTIDDP